MPPTGKVASADKSKLEDFRFIVRTAAADDGKTVAAYLHNELDEFTVSHDNEKVLSLEKFKEGLSKITKVKAKFSDSDFGEFFAECDEGERLEFTVDELADFCLRTVSKARALALKLRKVIVDEYENEPEFRKLFAKATDSKNVFSRDTDFVKFIELVEDMLDMDVSESDGLNIFQMFDLDGDRQVSVDDFIGFIMGRNADAVNVLKSGNGDVIVDIKISCNSAQEADLMRNGYVQLPEDPSERRPDIATYGSFGRGQSIWVWRRKQGVCSGRLKPIVDLQLISGTTSSALVLSGYVCVPVSVAGQWLWIKRASTEEEEKDAIVDIKITLGRLKVPSDPIWTSPGVGWIRVDGNFSKSGMGGMFSSQFDSFVWFRPSRTRSMDTHMASPVRSAFVISEEARHAKVLMAARTALRHYVPVESMRKLSMLVMDGEVAVAAAADNNTAAASERLIDFAALYHKYDTSGRGRLTRRILERMLVDVGIRMDAADSNRFFYFFHVDERSGYISREEYAKVLRLYDFEIDVIAEKIRNRLIASTRAASFSSSSSAADSSSKGSMSSSSGNNNNNNNNNNVIRENRILSGVFASLNKTTDGVLSVEETMDMASKLEIFVTEEEASKLLAAMAPPGVNKVTETDFVTFMKRRNDAVTRKAQRLRDVAALFRRWLARGSAGLQPASLTDKPRSMFFSTAPLTLESATETMWMDFKRAHERASRQQFPGYLSAENLILAVANLGTRISYVEARELALFIAPDKRGRVSKSDLTSFMGRNCRTFGELTTLLDRDILKPLVESYRTLRASVRTTGGSSRHDLQTVFDNQLKEAVRSVHAASPSADAGLVGGDAAVGGGGAGDQSKSKAQAVLDVISVYQLKAGLESYNRDRSTPGNLLPNLEEWANLAALVGADVAEEDTYGVRASKFLEGICEFIVGGLDVPVTNEIASLDMVTADLKRLIRDEAALAASKGKDRSKTHDFISVFNLFDVNENGSISQEELKGMLSRLQLINLLPDNQIPALLTKFDKKKKGYITVDDFITFAKEGESEGSSASLVDDDDDGDDDYEYLGQSSNRPPTAITKNADCDWLAWFLWREACKVEPSDPESVITELEAVCAENQLSHQEGNVTLKDLWSIAHELKLSGNMTKSQFEKGVHYVVADGSGQDDDLVDFEALCRYTVRMGRAYNGLVQEKKAADEKLFAGLYSNLKKDFRAMAQDAELVEQQASAEGKGKAKAEPPRYEKVLKRLDANGDGKVTIQEFKLALKRLRYKEEKLWSRRMIRRLFDELDRDKDGMMSIREFSYMLVDGADNGTSAGDGAAKPSATGRLSAGGSGGSGLSDDDDDDGVFSKHRTTTDLELFRKVNGILQETIPPSEGSGSASTRESHSAYVQKEVRRFFLKHDPDVRGTVSEERFRAFCRRSGLQDRLTVAEVRRLVDKLRRRRAGKEKGASLIDYEKLCRQLSTAGDSIPLSRSEGVFLRLQDACISSANAGRPFVTLCTLVDPRLTGKITREELQHTAKMIDCPLTNADIDAIKEISPEAFSSDGGSVDYKELNAIIGGFTSRVPSVFDNDLSLSYNHTSNSRLMGATRWGNNTGALPAYASPNRTTRMDNTLARSQFSTQDWGRSIVTPAGMSIATPVAAGGGGDISGGGGFAGGARNSTSSHLLAAGHSSATRPVVRNRGDIRRLQDDSEPESAFERKMALFAEKVHAALAVRSKARGIPIPVNRLFDDYDMNGGGVISGRDFEAALDELGVLLSPADLQNLYSMFGRPEDDAVDYRSFSSWVMQYTPSQSPRGGADDAPSYAGPRVIQRLRELRVEGCDPRDMFEIHDLNRTGTVTIRKFQDEICRLGLLQTEQQLSQAIDDFVCISDRSRVSYDDFCRALEQIESKASRLAPRPPSSDTYRRSFGNGSAVAADFGSRRSTYVDGNGYDGLRSRRLQPSSNGAYDGYDDADNHSNANTSQWLTRDNSTPKHHRGGRDSSDVYDSLNRFRSSLTDARAFRDDDEGSDRDQGGGYYGFGASSGLGAPKISDSISVAGNSRRPPLAAVAGGGGGGGRSSWGRAESLDEPLIAPGSPTSRSYGYGYGGSSTSKMGAGAMVNSSMRSSNASAILSPKTSPSKVGSALWGRDTPLAQKGKLPSSSGRGTTWVCAVCMYTDNPHSASQCTVCDCPNYNNRKEFVVQEQCRNCTFLNGQFSEECEMCGEPLRRKH